MSACQWNLSGLHVYAEHEDYIKHVREGTVWRMVPRERLHGVIVSLDVIEVPDVYWRFERVTRCRCGMLEGESA